jgi:putative transposase
LPRRTKKRLPVRLRQPLTVIPHSNAVWAIDFMSDTLYGGRRFRTLNILDEGVREGLAIEIDTSLPAERVIRVLEQVLSWRGQPQALRLDNGPELLADRFITWCAERGIELRYIQPGKPDQNAFIERFNRTYRAEVLNAYVSESLDQGREISAAWLQSDNEDRPHDALSQLATRHVPGSTGSQKFSIATISLTGSLQFSFAQDDITWPEVSRHIKVNAFIGLRLHYRNRSETVLWYTATRNKRPHGLLSSWKPHASSRSL